MQNSSKESVIELIASKYVMSLLLSFYLVFDSAKELSSDVITFLNMRFITTQKPDFEKILHFKELPSQEGFI